MVVGQPYPVDDVSQINPFDIDGLIANLEKGVASGDPALKQHLSMTTGVFCVSQVSTYLTSCRLIA